MELRPPPPPLPAPVVDSSPDERRRPIPRRRGDPSLGDLLPSGSGESKGRESLLWTRQGPVYQDFNFSSFYVFVKLDVLPSSLAESGLNESLLVLLRLPAEPKLPPSLDPSGLSSGLRKGLEPRRLVEPKK